MSLFKRYLKGIKKMYKLEIGAKLSGFLIKNKKRIDDIAATMYEMEHEGCGAQLIFLDSP